MLGIVIGVGIGIAAHFLFRFGLFIAGMIGGFAVANLILPETDVVVSTLDTLVWFGSAGLAGGLLTLILYKFFILLIISLIATCMIYMGTVTLLPPETASWSWVLYVVLLAVFFLVQVCAQKGHPDPMGRANRYREW